MDKSGPSGGTYCHIYENIESPSCRIVLFQTFHFCVDGNILKSQLQRKRPSAASGPDENDQSDVRKVTICCIAVSS